MGLSVIAVFVSSVNYRLALSSSASVGRSRSTPILEQILKLFGLDEGLKDFFLGFEVGCMAEERVLVLLEPLLGLDAIATQVDKVDKHHEKHDHDGDRDGDLDTQSPFTVVVGRASDANFGCTGCLIENSVEWELGEGSLAEGCVLVTIWKFLGGSGLNAKDAE